MSAECWPDCLNRQSKEQTKFACAPAGKLLEKAGNLSQFEFQTQKNRKFIKEGLIGFRID
jgi:hypothetical protein